MIQTLKRLNWRIFSILFVAGLLGVIAVLPFAMEMVGSIPIDRATVPDMPLSMIVVLALLQNGILLTVVIIVGMILSERIGLQMPLIRAWALGETIPNLKAMALPGILVGVSVGVVLVVLEAILFLQHLPAPMLALLDTPLWKRLLSGVLYGGIVEEIFMRLFLLSLVAWILGRWWNDSQSLPTTGAFWTAIIVVAALFGLGHLPATAAITTLTKALVVRALVLNGVAGIAFGYLYWKHGLEAAMIAHMTAHVVLQVPGEMLLRNML